MYSKIKEKIPVCSKIGKNIPSPKQFLPPLLTNLPTLMYSFICGLSKEGGGVVLVPDPFIKKRSGSGDLPVHSAFLCPHSFADQNNFITTIPTARVVKFFEVTEYF